ncbi:thioesterase family protein [Terricaulis sp.]|uniref:thioesterase family protein n=1 Tax=Terricaulis sp. TaxID=2768686 RepID=UPI003784906E
MTTLAAVLDELTPDEGAFAIEAPPAWSQGRTLYGGITAALMYEAVRRGSSDLAPLRSAQFTFVGPAAGRLRFCSSLLRRGRSSTLMAADAVNDAGHVARALFAFGATRESKVKHNFLPKPDVPAPDAVASFRKEGGDAPRGFWNNFETRLASGGRLLDANAKRPEFAVWTRFLDVGGGADPTTALLALADCLPPAAMVLFPEFGPISTMTWTVDIAHIPQRLDGWFLLWAASEQAGDGYSLQNMAMWDGAGALIATGRQTIAIFV